ncbi:hypothetical protein Leryth_015447 [Lithospermum erythrorhizon]|nr:hypothetical protein Leryth_015447 [Lithospermum erythrorhizon]
MEASFISSYSTNNLLGGGRFLNNPPRGSRRGGDTTNGKVVKAMKSGDHHHHHHNHYEGRLVDENMIILRVRIKKMKMSQRNGRRGPPENWMEWEKKYFGEQYHEDVCEVVGLLQVLLMNTRPSLALGVMLVLALTLPISTYIVMHNTSDIVQEFVSKLHFISCMYL